VDESEEAEEKVKGLKWNVEERMRKEEDEKKMAKGI